MVGGGAGRLNLVPPRNLSAKRTQGRAERPQRHLFGAANVVRGYSRYRSRCPLDQVVLRLFTVLMTVACVAGCGKARPVLPAASRAANATSAAKTERIPTPSVCTDSRAKLPVAAVTLRWQEDDRPNGLELRPNGEISRGATIVARILGSCVLDAQGSPLRVLDEHGSVFDGGEHPVGKFQSSPSRRGKSPPPWRSGETLVAADGSVNAITDVGEVYFARPGEEAISMPVGASGDIAHARRTVLLLLDLRDDLHP
jgi:hypothetical protein